MRRRNAVLSDAFRRLKPRSSINDFGPPVTFGVAVLAAFAVLAFATASLPRDVVLPMLATLYFALAALVALIAWRAGQGADHPSLTYWDVAGALVLFGVCAGTLLDSEQLLRLVQDGNRDE